MTRIIGGSARGRRLRTPPGSATRPTADRVREALFSALESELGTLSGLHVLDLFAGSGAVGLEARSRGAASVVLVESDRATAGVIRQNAKELGFDQVRVDVARAERWVDHADQTVRGARFDVVYADPPYPMSTADVSALLGRLAASGRLADDAVVVVERSRRGESWTWPIGLEGVREKRYGETMLLYGRVGTSDATPTSPGSS